jgi:prepilin-type N-terminal cleavage/methylation domain-containing protein
MDRRAFTLIEILVVIIVIGALAIIAVPSYTTHIERVRFVEGVETLTTLREAQIAYKAENAAYATTLGQLTVDIPASQNFQPPVIGNQASELARLRSNWSGVCFEITIDENGVIGCTDDATICGLASIDEVCSKMGNLVGIVH